jgi:hypothetical protein
MSELTYAQSMALARHQLSAEYLDRATKLLSKWITEAEKEWKDKGVRLPYPTHTLYPPEVEVVARAEELRKASANPANSVPAHTTHETTTTPVAQPVQMQKMPTITPPTIPFNIPPALKSK